MEQSEEFVIDSNWNEGIETFGEMNLKQELLHGINSSGFLRPLAIQQKGIRPIILGRDIIAQTQFRAGKTVTFIVGILEMIDSAVPQCQALILVPIRDLAKNTQSAILQIGQFLKINCHTCIGGTAVSEDIRILADGVHIVVGTPGRVLDMILQNHLPTQHIKIFVLDDADEILARGFKDQIQEIFRHLPESVQCCLFASTMPPDILNLTKNSARDPIRILINKEELIPENIAQYYIPVENEDCKFALITDLLENLDFSQAIIYVSNFLKVETLSKQMTEKDFAVSFMHGGMDQTQREMSIKEFRIGSTRVLITTDLLGRIIDVPHISVSINYDMPTSYESYLHRISRGHRCVGKGVAISLVTEADTQFIKHLEQNYNTNIKELPEDLSHLL